MVYVLDTHPIVWFVENSSHLSPAARAIMVDPTAELVVPTMALIEIRFLYAKGRIAASYADIQRDLISATNCTIYPADEEVASLIPVNLNIHDAIIVATAFVYRDLFKQPTSVVTKDLEIKASGLVETVW